MEDENPLPSAFLVISPARLVVNCFGSMGGFLHTVDENNEIPYYRERQFIVITYSPVFQWPILQNGSGAAFAEARNGLIASEEQSGYKVRLRIFRNPLPSLP
jgi:hypothetical protein